MLSNIPTAKGVALVSIILLSYASMGKIATASDYTHCLGPPRHFSLFSGPWVNRIDGVQFEETYEATNLALFPDQIYYPIFEVYADDGSSKINVTMAITPTFYESCATKGIGFLDVDKYEQYHGYIKTNDAPTISKEGKKIYKYKPVVLIRDNQLNDFKVIKSKDVSVDWFYKFRRWVK